MPDLAEALNAAVQVHLASIAESSRQRENDQRVARATVLKKVIEQLKFGLTDERTLTAWAMAWPVLELSTNERTTDKRSYLTTTYEGIGVGVVLWPDAGPEHEIERGFFIKTCRLCDKPIAVPIHTYKPGDIAASYLVNQHIESLGCDDPF